MIVRWCIKGLTLADDAEACAIIDNQRGLLSNWWRTEGTITPQGRRERLTRAHLDMHVNHFTADDPVRNKPVREVTPFISLTAGTVERDRAAETNYVHRARREALRFGMQFGEASFAYLFVCWVVLAPRQAVEIEGVAEEVRDLNTYRRYSDFQTEGEIVAKVHVPDNQIQRCEKWSFDLATTRLWKDWSHVNPRFTPPERLSNVRELI